MKAKAGKPFWIYKQGVFSLAIPWNAFDGWRIRFKIGQHEADFETRYVRLRDAEKAAEAIWKMLLDGP
jgi:hypothetical protein